MRIKRFIASDMRTALRMVRDEQGPDAVILSNRPCVEGVEVVSATDYDEALVHQALRAAAPALAAVPAAAVAANAPAQPTPPMSVPAPAVGAIAAPAPPPVRETLASRARAVFKLGDDALPTAIEPTAEPTLAELIGSGAATPPAAPTRFESMMAALGAPPTPASQSTAPQAPVMQPPASQPPVPMPAHDDDRAGYDAIHSGSARPGDDAIAPPSIVSPPALSRPTEADAMSAEAAAAAQVPHLQAVPRWDADPAVAAMREELAAMRQVIEREMGQFAVERLRGSPARAAAFDTLLGYGSDEALAQTIAAKIDPTLDPTRVRAPLLAELARMLTVNRAEPIDDGGVIALIGPTGAGKTTTAAKLAARFAARHRARDVALVTTDAERVGAREQLHAHGRKLGVTVCEAHGPEALARTLEQLVDYPLVIVDTAGFGARDRALLGQLTWLRATRNVRSLLVLPANAHPHDMNEVVRRYRMATPEGVVLTKLDETGRLGAALSVVIRNGLSLAYTADGQQVATDLAQADPSHLVLLLEKLRRAADNPLATEDRHAVVC
ncbi:MAG: AAA family ATPase [Lysobacter sp.]